MNYSNLLLILTGYLLGSIPTAYLVARWVRGVDIRRVGDGNAGAANVAQQVGFIAGAVVAVVDISKGVAAVIIARHSSPIEAVALLAGLAAVSGHNWSALLHFQGGRGAATALGVMIVFLSKETALLLAIAAIPFLLSRNTKLFFPVLFAPLFLVAWRFGQPAYLVAYAIAIPTVVLLTDYWKTRNLRTQVEQEKVLGNDNGI